MVATLQALCPNCQFEVPDNARYCHNCGAIRSAYTETLTRVSNIVGVPYDDLSRRFHDEPALPVEWRQAVLQSEIGRHVMDGYRVVSQTPTTAQLVKVKQFNWLWAILWTLFTFGPGIFVYVIYFAAKSEPGLYLSVDEWGQMEQQIPSS